jgi:hypothetical protein
MKQRGRYLLILIAVMALWNTIVIKPLKLFSVFLHELGHALMSLVFGFGIQGLRINPDESGYALVLPKGWLSSFLIANGGYLGSLFFALLIIILKRTKFKKFILGTAAVVLLAVAIRFSGISFTLLYAAIFAAFALVVYMIQNDTVIDWVVDILGISSVAYAIYDVFVDTVLLQINLKLHLISGWYAQQPKTDAVQLAQMTGIPAVVWGLIWLTVMILAVNFVIIKKGGAGRSRGRSGR